MKRNTDHLIGRGSLAQRLELGRLARQNCPRSALGLHKVGGRDALAHLTASNQGRIAELLPTRFGRMLAGPKYVMRFNIQPGECIVFDNHRIVHGRDAYSATSGDRYLRGCYADRGELRSAYRVLAGEGRFK